MKRLLSYLDTIRKICRNQVPLPRFPTYIVTFTCNARCIMCDSWKKPSRGDLTLDEIGNIFDQLPRMDVVRLSGGEPFVRQDLPDIVHLAQEKLRPMVLHVTSNGFLPERIVRFCEQRKKNIPLHLLISVDGMAEKHNYVRGHKKAFDFIEQTLKALAPRQKDLRLKLAVNQTIVDAEGIEHYKRLREYLRPYGIRNNFVMAYDVSATYNLEQEVEVAPSEIGQFSTFGEFSLAQLRELFDEVEKDLAGDSLINRIGKRYYLNGIRNRLLHGKGQPNPTCVALYSHLRLLPDGRVPTCQFNTMSVGNLKEQSFAEIWNGKKIRRQRQWVRGCPGCWAECEVLPNAVYSGDLLKNIFFRGFSKKH